MLRKTEKDMGQTSSATRTSELIAFDSATYPASAAGDPDAGAGMATGCELLQRILDMPYADQWEALHSPSAEGSGCSVYVRVSGRLYSLHLTWYPAQTPQGTLSDVWTLQAQDHRGCLAGLARMFVRGEDERARALLAQIAQVLSERPQEFTDVRTCAWSDLEHPAG